MRSVGVILIFSLLIVWDTAGAVEVSGDVTLQVRRTWFGTPARSGGGD